MSLRTRCCKTFVFALLTLAILAVPAFGAGSDTLCLQTESQIVNKQKLNCTANDVRVAAVSNVQDLSGNPIATCIEGSKFSFTADFQIITTANATNSGGRDNIGLYFQTDPTVGNALIGSTCTDNIIAPQHPCSSDPATGTCGSTGYKEFDASPDNCGDTSSSVNGNITDRILVKDFVCTTANSVACPNDPTKQCLSLPNCTSWQVPGSSILCQTSAPAYAYPLDGSGNPEAIPGSPSKCNCAVIPLPIQPVNPKPLALKACNTKTTGSTPSFTFDPNSPPGTASPTSCDAGVEGVDAATYTVAIDNPNVSGAFGDIVVDQICDSAYGQVFPASGSCAAGSTGKTITSTDCSALDIPLGQFKTCTFVAPTIGELGKVQDIVTVSGHSAVNNTVTFSGIQTNQVTVTSTDAPSTATVAKGFSATLAACATVRYNVEVDNTSSADEVETLSVLNDSPFGDLTKLGSGAAGTVLGTTCGVATGSVGLGTLKGSSGAGVFPASIAVSGSYKCQFDGQFCSAVDSSTCIQNDDQVTATVVGDESTDTTFTAVSNLLRVKECLTASTPTP